MEEGNDLIYHCIIVESILILIFHGCFTNNSEIWNMKMILTCTLGIWSCICWGHLTCFCTVLFGVIIY